VGTYLPCSASLPARREEAGVQSFPLLPAPSPGDPESPCLFGQAEDSGTQDVQSQVLQETLKRLDKAFKFMKERGFGFPRFKVWTLLGKWLQRQLKIKSKATTTVYSISSTSCTCIPEHSPRISLSNHPSVVRSSRDALC